MTENQDNGLDDVLTPIEDVVEPTAETKTQEDDIPEKYKGKSAKDIIAMHQEAEKLIGRTGSEVGELRKIVDDFIKAQVSETSTTTETDDDDTDFYADPKQAVNKAIENHPAVKEAKKASGELTRNRAIADLSAKHPDFMETVTTQEFAEWVKGSKVRVELFTRAETQFDVDAADELLSTWKERKQVAKTIEADRSNQMKAASVTSTSSSDGTSKKIYRRSDIINLMKTDPKRYQALSEDILKAYSEGRVK